MILVKICLTFPLCTMYMHATRAPALESPSQDPIIQWNSSVDRFSLGCRLLMAVKQLPTGENFYILISAICALFSMSNAAPELWEGNYILCRHAMDTRSALAPRRQVSAIYLSILNQSEPIWIVMSNKNIIVMTISMKCATDGPDAERTFHRLLIFQVFSDDVNSCRQTGIRSGATQLQWRMKRLWLMQDRWKRKTKTTASKKKLFNSAIHAQCSNTYRIYKCHWYIDGWIICLSYP